MSDMARVKNHLRTGRDPWLAAPKLNAGMGLPVRNRSAAMRLELIDHLIGDEGRDMLRLTCYAAAVVLERRNTTTCICR